MSTEPLIGINDIEGTELEDYRPLCLAAVVGLGLGIFSFLAFFHPVLWAWPLVSAAVCIVALVQLARSDRLIGRKAAVWGLFLAVAFGVAAPLRMGAYYLIEQREARAFGEAWFQAVLNGDMYKAHQMSTMPLERKPIDDQLPGLYEKSPDLRSAVDTYQKAPLLATLRALGTKAVVRHYLTESCQTDGRIDLVEDIYVVTYDDAGQKKSFFIKASLVRNLIKDAGPRIWRVQSPEGGYKPKSWN